MPRSSKDANAIPTYPGACSRETLEVLNLMYAHVCMIHDVCMCIHSNPLCLLDNRGIFSENRPLVLVIQALLVQAGSDIT